MVPFIQNSYPCVGVLMLCIKVSGFHQGKAYMDAFIHALGQ